MSLSLLAAICLQSAAPVAAANEPTGCPLPDEKFLTAQQIAEVQKETEAALQAEYKVKAATVTKYLGDSDATTHPAFISAGLSSRIRKSASSRG